MDRLDKILLGLLAAALVAFVFFALALAALPLGST
jgi:hypothetical protein